ncbi:MAG: phage major capsid protein [Lachnospiraceae bacterium]|nr:phage major capsid protein [Lachnospiraceae bacterium]
MTKQELLNKRAALIAEIDGADEKRFAEIKAEIAKVDYQLGLAADDEQRAAKDNHDDEQRAARDKTVTPPVNGADERGAQIIASNGDVPVKGVATADMAKETALRFAKSAFGKQVRAALEKLPVNLSENEKRAIGIAITTTSETYKAPSAAENGVNNGGIFIPQNVLYDLLELETADSAFFRDVKATHIKGALVFPYVLESNNGEGKGKKETVAANDRSVKWGKLTLAQGNYPLTIEVTMELLALTDEEFAEYLLADLANEMNILLADESLYGTGKNDCIEGVTVGAIQGATYSAGGEADAIKAGLLKLSRRARRGAKVYISRSMSLDMAFEKDKDGRYIFPIYNSTGISSIVTVPVEVDEALHDGDFVIGNASNYKLNFTKMTEVYPEIHGKTRVIEYTAHVMVAGKAAPDKFYYGKKSTTSTPASNG